MKIKKSIPCFSFGHDELDDLFNATIKARLEISPITISHKKLDDDLNRIVESASEPLARNNLYMTFKVIYENDYALSAVIHHSVSEQKYEERYSISASKDAPIEFECSIKYLKIQSYIKIIGLSIIDAEDCAWPLDLKMRDAMSISQSDIKKFFECPRCFYLSKKGIKLPFQLDSKASLGDISDSILKKEFDACRETEVEHPIMKINNIDAIPFKNNNINIWRESNYGKGGIKFFDQERNFIFTGVVDDVWINQQGNLIIVDYKTTSKESISLKDELSALYRRQISFYAWLFKKNGYRVSSKGYLIIDKPRVNPKYDYRDVIFGKVPEGEYVFSPYSKTDEYKRILAFDTDVLEVPIDFTWIEEALNSLIDCLNNNQPPKPFRNKRTYKPCSLCEFFYKSKIFEDRLSKNNQQIEGGLSIKNNN